MRLANGIVLDKEKTFGVLKFSALRHEVRVENEDGTTSEEIKRRTYDLKCSQQERTIQVSIPAEIPVKDYIPNANAVHYVVDMIRAEFLEDVEVTEDIASLIILLDKSKLLKTYFSEYEQKEIKKKLKEITNSDTGKSIKDTVI